MKVETSITAAAIDATMVLRDLPTSADGAVLLFAGTVRAQNEGRAVRGMRYDAYQDMAEQVLREIAEEAAARWTVTSIVARHRTGELEIGEVSVVVGVAAPHRADAFDAGRHVIEAIKQRLPVWKKEHYTDESVWLEGSRPPIPETSFE
jgi:molybdopterin synthase catalytic subunit